MHLFNKKNTILFSTMFAATIDFACADVNFGVEPVLGRAKQYEEGGTILTAWGNSSLYGMRFVSEFNRYLRADVGYLDFGEVRKGQAEVQASSVQIGVVGILPLSKWVSLTARSGINLSNGRFSYLSFNNQPVNESDASGSDPFFGLGVSVNISDMTSINVGYDYNELKWEEYENVVESISIGWLWRFGAL